MNRIVKVNNYTNPISIKEIEFKINELYNNNIISSNKQCRICLEEDDKKYISPCLCKGSSKYIHIECLNQWRNMNIHNIEKKNSCEICKYKFKFKNNVTINYLKYKIFNKYYLIRLLFLWFFSMVIIWFEVNTDFFLIRTLTLYNYNSSLLNNFRNFKLSEKTFYINYGLFYIPLTFFISEVIYTLQFHLKCYKIFNTFDYKYDMKCYINRYYIQTFLYLYYYYIGLSYDMVFFYIYSTFFVTFFNIFYRISFIKKHNKVIDNIISENENTTEILSFSENILINDEFAEKKEQKYNYHSDHSNNSDFSNSSVETFDSNDNFFNDDVFDGGINTFNVLNNI